MKGIKVFYKISILKFLVNLHTYVRTYVRTDGRTDGRTDERTDVTDMSELVLTTSECIDYEFFAVFLLSYSRFDVKCQLLFWDACLCHIKGAIRSEEQCKVNGKGVPCYEIEFTIIIVFYDGKFFNSVSFLIVYYHT